MGFSLIKTHSTAENLLPVKHQLALFAPMVPPALGY
ncbi:hypothetical protein CGLO_14904 [Colletotrichum gloeosporioides Cg-14]|uniref:Uncharacterized protein n=1 Tax=Colletotrichum gloeosporioides (strain Cg-14) TaxID=1237896 RepID=T0L374_COLGC|nr:hypothetical protein CGLO_14904 [Colletotrichum gloeosporioides Cg-14]